MQNKNSRGAVDTNPLFEVQYRIKYRKFSAAVSYTCLF